MPQYRSDNSRLRGLMNAPIRNASPSANRLRMIRPRHRYSNNEKGDASLHPLSIKTAEVLRSARGGEQQSGLRAADQPRQCHHNGKSENCFDREAPAGFLLLFVHNDSSDNPSSGTHMMRYRCMRRLPHCLGYRNAQCGINKAAAPHVDDRGNQFNDMRYSPRLSSANGCG